jgi:hypothetical protein
MNSTDARDRSLLDLSHAVMHHGFAVMPVGYGGCSVPGCCSPASEIPWTYTIGRVDRDAPELVVLGLDPETAHFLTHLVDDLERAGTPLLPGQTHALDDALIRLDEVPDQWLATDPHRMAAWMAYYGWRDQVVAPRVCQIVWSDEQGRFPDDEDCHADTAWQPLLAEDPVTYPRSGANRLERRRARRRRRRP